MYLPGIRARITYGSTCNPLTLHGLYDCVVRLMTDYPYRIQYMYMYVGVTERECACARVDLCICVCICMCRLYTREKVRWVRE